MAWLSFFVFDLVIGPTGMLKALALERSSAATSCSSGTSLSLASSATSCSSPSCPEPPCYELAMISSRVNILLLVAALVATMTFAAGFTMPGGFNSSAPNSGMAILVHDGNLTNFLMMDAMAMYSSVVAILALIWAQLGDQELSHKAFHLALPSLFVALFSMSWAFYYGLRATTMPNSSLTSSIATIFWIFIFVMIGLLTPYVIPQISGIPMIHFVTSQYLFMLLSFVNEDDDEKHNTFGSGYLCVKKAEETVGSSSGVQVEKSKEV